MVEVVDRDFGAMLLALQRQNHVRLAFAPPVQELADLGEPRFQLLQLGRRQLDLPAGVRDLHGFPPF